MIALSHPTYFLSNDKEKNLQHRTILLHGTVRRFLCFIVVVMQTGLNGKIVPEWLCYITTGRTARVVEHFTYVVTSVE